MSTGRHFTARSDGDGVVVSFDDGTSRQYDPSVGADLLAVLDARPHTSPVFSAATAASFAEAESSEPDPVADGPVLERAVSRATRVRTDAIPVGHLTANRSTPLADLLEERKSDRQLAPPRLEELVTVLVRSARVITWTYDERGVETSFRPHPSAGALHPLALEVIVTDVDGLANGCWEFDPFRCDLIRSSRPQDQLVRALRLIGDAARCEDIPACIVIVANPSRTLSRYPRGTAHLWRDTGALLATLHLSAADVGLASTIVGTSGVLDRFDRTGTGSVDVGALAIGTALSEDD